jgi:hypothetical protein
MFRIGNEAESPDTAYLKNRETHLGEGHGDIEALKINHTAVIVLALAGFVAWMVWAVMTQSPDAILK